MTTCRAANPFDDAPDDIALQACLDAYDRVLLVPDGQPGYVGYLIANTLKPKRPGQLLTSAAIPRKATMVAAPGLGDAMLRVSGLADFEISFIRFDGNREQRPRGKPCVTGNDLRNVELTGAGFHVRYVESFGAVCGSAMTVGGSSNYEIYQSLFYDNGRQPEEADGVSGLWADGLTVFDCRNSTIRDNDFWDNTDVDLGVNGGRSCSVYRNTISHFSKYGFAGVVVGDPSQTGGEFSANIVSSGYNLLGFGIIVPLLPFYAKSMNAAPWQISLIFSAYSMGGFFGEPFWGRLSDRYGRKPLLISTIENNTMRFSQGDRVLNCDVAADYTVGHVIDVARLQPGYVVRTYDAGSACQQTRP